jgi:hypothetical protein
VAHLPLNHRLTVTTCVAWYIIGLLLLLAGLYGQIGQREKERREELFRHGLALIRSTTSSARRRYPVMTERVSTMTHASGSRIVTAYAAPLASRTHPMSEMVRYAIRCCVKSCNETRMGPEPLPDSACHQQQGQGVELRPADHAWISCAANMPSTPRQTCAPRRTTVTT